MKGPMIPRPIVVPGRHLLAGVAASALLATCLSFGASLPVLAATIVVTTTSDPPVASTNCPAAANPCSLRAAIQAANAASGANHITFAVDGVFKITKAAGGVLDVTGRLSQQLSIQGDGASKTILDGQDEDHSVILIRAGVASISGLNVRNGHTFHGFQGAGISNYGALTLTAVNVTGNTVESGDGDVGPAGAGIASSGPLTVIGSTISLNHVNQHITSVRPSF